MAELVYSFHSDNSGGSSAAPPKTGVSQEPLIQVGPDLSSEAPVSDPLIDIGGQKPVRYPLPQVQEGMKQQHDTPLIQGGVQYMPQYAGPVPISPYYPLYQMPVHPQHVSCHPNQPYPIYLVPMRPPQYQNIPMACSSIDANTVSPSTLPPLHPKTAVIPPPVGHKEVFGAQISESVTYCSNPASSQLVNIPSNQGQLVVGSLEHQIPSESANSIPVASTTGVSDFDEEIAYSQIYKSQPSAPILPSHYQTMTKGTTTFPEPSVHAK